MRISQNLQTFLRSSRCGGALLLIRKTAAVGLLRVLAGATQFAVILFIAEAFSLSDVGQYSIFVIVLGYYAQLAGLSFHTYVMRAIAGQSQEHFQQALMQTWWFMGVSISCALLLALLTYGVGWLPTNHLLPFLSLLVLTVINTQHENFLVGTRHPVLAAIGLLLRSFWILPLAIVHFTDSSTVDILVLYYAWISSEAASAAFGLFVFSSLGYWPRYRPLDVSWILPGVRLGAGYTVLSLVLLLTVSVQRLVLAKFFGDEMVGIFHFFYVISVFLPNLLEATLFAILLPKLIAEYRSLGGAALGPPKPAVFAFLLGIGLFGLVTLWFVLPFGATLLDKPELVDHRQVLLYTAGYALLYTASRALHYQLYASNRDVLLARANLISCFASCLSALVLIPEYGLQGAVMSLLFTGGVMFISFGWPFSRLGYAR